MPSTRNTTKSNLEALVEFAKALGWSAHERPKNNGTLLHAPEPNQAIRIPVPNPNKTSVRQSWFTSSTRRVVKYGEPNAVEAVAKAVASTGDHEFAYILRQANVELVALMPGTEAHQKYEEQRLEQAAAEEDRRIIRKNNDDDTTPIENEPKPELVESHPWMARKGSKSSGGGKRYTSHAVIERHWSNGTIDYACAQPGCLFEDESPNRVAHHYGRAADHVRPSAADQLRRERETVFDPNYQPSGIHYTHRQARVQTMAQRIARGLDKIEDWRNLVDDELAERLADILTPERENLNESGEPLSDEQIIEKIRRLLDRGEYIQMQERIVELAQQVTSLEVEEQAQRDRADRATGDLQAFASLVEETRQRYSE